MKFSYITSLLLYLTIPILCNDLNESLNFTKKFDIDGDEKSDKIFFAYSGGAHCCYTLHITLSSDSITREYPFNMDGGYIAGVPDNSRPEHFNIKDYDGDGLPEIFMEIETYNLDRYSIPQEWKATYGIETNYIYFDFSDSLYITSFPKHISVEQYFLSKSVDNNPSRLIPFSKDSLFGYKDENGTVAILNILEEAHVFSWGVAVVTLHKKEYLIDSSGKIISDFNNYDPIDKKIEKGGLLLLDDATNGYYFIDEKGTIVNDSAYYDALPFSEGLAAVKDERTDKWGFINRENILVIAYLFDFAHPFENGRATVLMDGDLYSIDTSGKVLRQIEK